MPDVPLVKISDGSIGRVLSSVRRSSVIKDRREGVDGVREGLFVDVSTEGYKKK